jgi:hypothetical protein
LVFPGFRDPYSTLFQPIYLPLYSLDLDPMDDLANDEAKWFINIHFNTVEGIKTL